jgi:hypothetical protein
MKSEDIKLESTPSVRTIKATFDEIISSTETIKKDVQSLLVTLEAVDGILDVFTNSTNLGSQLRSINPITWSIPATAKLVLDVISNYVSNKTGLSFTDWISFIDSILSKFTDYTKQLDKIPSIASKYNSVSFENQKKTGTESTQDELELLTIKLETGVWKNYIEQAAKLSVILDAVLDAQRETEFKVATQGEVTSGVGSDLKKIWGSITHKTNTVTNHGVSDIQRQVIKWFFSSIYDLRGSTKNFTKQTRDLLPKLSDLENLLELEIAQIQVYSGKIKEKQVELLEVRVAATIIVPQLIESIEKHRKDIFDCNNYLDKLQAELENGNINDQTYNALSLEYKATINSATRLLEQTSAQAKIWKQEGVVLIETGLEWANKELDVIKARRLVGQLTLEDLKKKSMVINEEIHRLEKAKEMLHSL